MGVLALFTANSLFSPLIDCYDYLYLFQKHSLRVGDRWVQLFQRTALAAELVYKPGVMQVFLPAGEQYWGAVVAF